MEITAFTRIVSFLLAFTWQQAQRLTAATHRISELRTMGGLGGDPSLDPDLLAVYHRRCQLYESIIAFLIGVQKRAGIAYTDEERMKIITLVEHHSHAIRKKKDLRRLFGVDHSTFCRWKRRMLGFKDAALSITESMLRHQRAFFTHLVKRSMPFSGKRLIAAILNRLGIQTSASTVRRDLTASAPRRPSKAPRISPQKTKGKLNPRYPNHFWGADVTFLSFFGIPLPILAVMDLYSRRIFVLKVFWRVTKRDVCDALRLAIDTFGAPGHLVTDHGPEFKNLNLGIDHRKGRVGSPASTARVERFFRSLKFEGLRFLLLPFIPLAQRYAGQYKTYHNEYRPHRSLGNRTPDGVYFSRGVRPRPTGEARIIHESDIKTISFCGGRLVGFRRKIAA